jgi:hypothetical protein
MFGTREFRFSYTEIETGETRFIMARNIWLANKALIGMYGEGFKDLKRAPFPKKERLTTGHCQICGREIGTTVGLIAHHGYTRPWPGSGSQTSSCYGARHVAYEVGHDALDSLIPIIRDDIKRFTERLADWNANPPATVTYTRRDAYGSVVQKVELERPADFDPKTAKSNYRPIDYVTEYLGHRGELQQWLKFAQYDLNALTKRRAEWKAPK